MSLQDDPFYGHPDSFPFSRYRAKGIRAVDGDTIIAGVEKELGVLQVMTLRLSTIDTYELHTGAYKILGEQARKFSDDKVRGKWIRLYSVMDTEKYGRTLTAIEYQTESGTWLDLADRLRFAGFEKPVKGAWRRRQETQRAQRILKAIRQ